MMMMVVEVVVMQMKLGKLDEMLILAVVVMVMVMQMMMRVEVGGEERVDVVTVDAGAHNINSRRADGVY